MRVESSGGEIIKMLDALGYLRNGSVIWMRVPKDFTLDFKSTYPGGDQLICANDSQGKPFDYVSTAVVEELKERGYIRCRIESDTSNANSDVLFCELEGEGEKWYLSEYPRWQELLHHSLS